MSLRFRPQPVPRPCFPRVSGDEPSVGMVLTQTAGFSPRERG